jgi:hypothetical protein
MAEKPNRADAVIIRDIVNMARIPSAPNEGTVPDMASMGDRAGTSFMPNRSTRPILPDEANTLMMPDMANMARAPDIPNEPSYFTLRPSKPWHYKHDYRRPHLTRKHWKQIRERAYAKFDKDHERGEEAQFRHTRALAWWQAWHHLEAAQHEVAVRTLWQINVPNLRNNAYLHAA